MKRKIYIPHYFTEQQLKIAEELYEDIIHKIPESENDYFLVDELGDDINIKAFKGDELDNFCKENNITPTEYLMQVMYNQNINR